MSKPKVRGRPKDMNKRAAIIIAAHQLFLHRGFQAVKIEEIADAANVSKMTVYANFDDKTAIFESVVVEQNNRMEQSLSHFQAGTDSVETILVQFGKTLMSFILTPEVMRFDQMLAAVKSNHNNLGLRFYEAGPNRMWNIVTCIIEAAAIRTEIQTDDARRAAEDLIALWLGNVPLQHRFNELEALSNLEIEERVVRGVTNFMKIYGPAKT